MNKTIPNKTGLSGSVFGWSNLTLGTKLTVAFLIVTIIPLMLLAYINDRNSRQALTTEANEKLSGAAQQTAAILDEFMLSNLDSIRTQAQFAAVVDYMLLPPEKRANSPEETRMNIFLSSAARNDPVYISSIAILDKNGITLADTETERIGTDRSSRFYFRKVLDTNAPYASDVEYDVVTKKPSLYFAAPVHDGSGNIIAVLRERYDAEILMEYISEQSGLVGAGSFALLLDEQHMRLAQANNVALIYKLVTPLDPAVVADLQAKRLLPPGNIGEISTNQPSLEAGLDNADTQPFFVDDVQGDGILEQVAVAKMKTQNWQVAFAIPQEEYLSSINTQARNNLLLTLAFSVVVGFLGLVVSRTLSGPIIRLTQTAEAIAAGDINIQAKVETGDEIGTLAKTFNRMTQQLRDFIVSLEERVAARTKDLRTVAEVGTATSTILESTRLLQTVVDLTKERFNLYHSHIYLLDESGENLVLAAGAGEPGRIMASEKRSIPVSREQSLVARASRERKGVTVNDVTRAPDFLPNPLLPETRSELAVPMLVGDTLIGVFDIQSDVVGRFTDSDVNIQTTLAAQLASSIQNARSYERSKAQADFEATLNAINQKIQRAGSIEETLQTAVRELGTVLGAARVKAQIGKPNGNSANQN